MVGGRFEVAKESTSQEIKQVVESLPSKVGQKSGFAVFTEAGVHTFQLPQGVTKFLVSGFGAGAGGGGGGGGGQGGGCRSNNAWGGSGGGGGGGANGGHGFHGLRIPIKIPDGIGELQVTVGKGGKGGIGGAGGAGAGAGADGTQGQTGYSGESGGPTSFGQFLTLLGGNSGAGGYGGYGGKYGQYTTTNVPGAGGTQGAGAGVTPSTSMTFEGRMYNQQLNMLPELFIGSLTANTGGANGTNGATGVIGGGAVGIGGQTSNVLNETYAERDILVKYLALFHTIVGPIAIGGRGNKGNSGGKGVGVTSSVADAGLKGENAFDGNAGILLIEWG